MSLPGFLSDISSSLEEELHHQISRLDNKNFHSFHEILTYHMGWSGDGSGPVAQGKRIRPMIVLLVCSACGGNWRNALPAAAAVELIHNFSLVHDDIQDNSKTRRGRDAVWVKWGIPMGINCGNTFFVLANLAINDLTSSYSSEIIIKATNLLQETCFNLTCGQYLDIAFEKTHKLTIEDYWLMIEGKTASLFSACCSLGALLGGLSSNLQDAYQIFGLNLGKAFQVQDDILGIWGDAALTGKSIKTDFISGKKSLPVIFGLEKKGVFYDRLSKGSIPTRDAKMLAYELETEGARLFAQQQVDRLTTLAVNFLDQAHPQGEAGEALYEICIKLLHRQA